MMGICDGLHPVVGCEKGSFYKFGQIHIIHRIDLDLP
jgi:hypothetical protein